MTRFGERFFTSLGFEPLPQTFWERSLFVKPRDREVVCHASAWNINNVDDLRIKMCIDQTEEDFRVIHHELGHNFYARAYNGQPMIFRDGANDGFHEAIGDTIALSVTPEYLVKVGLLDRAPDASGDIPLLLRTRARAPGLPAVRPRRRPVAVARVQRRGHTRSLQLGVVGAARAIPGRSARRRRAARSSSIRAPSTTSRPTRRTRGTSSRPCCSSSSTARWRRKPAARRRCTAARSTAAPRPASGCRRRWRWAQSRPWPDALEALTGQRQMDATRDGRLLRAAEDVARRAEQGAEESDGSNRFSPTCQGRLKAGPYRPLHRLNCKKFVEAGL